MYISVTCMTEIERFCCNEMEVPAMVWGVTSHVSIGRVFEKKARHLLINVRVINAIEWSIPKAALHSHPLIVQ